MCGPTVESSARSTSRHGNGNEAKFEAERAIATASLLVSKYYKEITTEKREKERKRRN